MRNLLAFTASPIEYARYLTGALLCAAGYHDWRAVRPVSGAFVAYEDCGRDGCEEKRNFVRRD